MAALSKGTRADSLSASTTGAGTAYSVPHASEHFTVLFEGTGTISGGTILLEESDNETYTGTWSTITSITGTAITGGAAQVVHFQGLVRAIRARVSATITGGGTVTTGIIVG